MGIALAYGGVAALVRFGPSEIPRLQSIAIDSEVLLYGVAATAVCALIFGFAPAWRLARTGIGETLKRGARGVAGPTHQRMRRTLAAVEIALAFVLIVSGGLLLRSFIAMIGTDPGFRASGVITASIELPPVQVRHRCRDSVLYAGARADTRTAGGPGRRVLFRPAMDRLRREHRVRYRRP